MSSRISDSLVMGKTAALKCLQAIRSLHRTSVASHQSHYPSKLINQARQLQRMGTATKVYLLHVPIVFAWLERGRSGKAHHDEECEGGHGDSSIDDLSLLCEWPTQIRRVSATSGTHGYACQVQCSTKTTTVPLETQD